MFYSLCLIIIVGAIHESPAKENRNLRKTKDCNKKLLRDHTTSKFIKNNGQFAVFGLLYKKTKHYSFFRIADLKTLEIPDMAIGVYDWKSDVNMKGRFCSAHAVMKQMREQKETVALYSVLLTYT